MSVNSQNPYADFHLLVDGREAFPAILQAIGEARGHIVINMFIWRDDDIGNRLAQAVLDAAQRGVKVEISVDRYGVVLERSEESKKSFFHKTQTLAERIKIGMLEMIYPMKGAPKRAEDTESDLYRQIMNHPNITVSRDVFKADHSKYYIIDGEILILGGVNVEDKENGTDMQGRVYQDYMVRMDGREYVDAFLHKLKTGENIATGYSFGINRKALSPRHFEMERIYLDMIGDAHEELIIHMAYFSPLDLFVRAIVDAHRRGVRVTVMIPEAANYQSDSNKKTVKRLMRLTKNGITLYFTPKMMHTKMVINEKMISFGSTNITKKAFGQLDELNLQIENVACPLRDALFESIADNQALAHKITDDKEIKYNRFLAFLEGFLV